MDSVVTGGRRVPHRPPGVGLRARHQFHRLHGPRSQRVHRRHRRALPPLRTLHLRPHGMAGSAPRGPGGTGAPAADRTGRRHPHRGSPRHHHLCRPGRHRRRGHRALPAAEPGGTGDGRACPAGPSPRLPRLRTVRQRCRPARAGPVPRRHGPPARPQARRPRLGGPAQTRPRPGYPPATGAGVARDTVTVLHLAGPGFGRGREPDALSRQLRGDIVELRDAGAPAPDLLVVTGDLTASGSPASATRPSAS